MMTRMTSEVVVRDGHTMPASVLIRMNHAPLLSGGCIIRSLAHLRLGELGGLDMIKGCNHVA